MLNKTMIFLTAILCVMLAYAALSFADTPTPIINTAGIKDSFRLVDQNGHAVTEKSWPGKYKLVFFGFTSCPAQCPATLQKLTAALNALGNKAEKIQTLFITVDPDTDKPAVLKAYLKNFDKSIAGLTGTKKQVMAAEESYKVFASKADEGSIDHSAFVYFMSPDGKLLQTFGIDESAENIVKGVNAFTDGASQK